MKTVAPLDERAVNDAFDAALLFGAHGNDKTAVANGDELILKLR